MASGTSRIWMRTGMLLASALVILQLTACGDKEAISVRRLTIFCKIP